MPHAWTFAPSGDAYALQMTERPPREPGPGEVALRVRAVSLNYRDLINLKKLAGRDVAGRIAASDGAGEVVRVGPGVSRFRPGDRAAAIFFQGWIDGKFSAKYHHTDLGGTIDGMLAEEVVLSEQGLVPIPDGMSFEQAAALPCAGVTAWQALVTRGRLQAGATVLVLGTGGVSILALQIARTLGARVIVTSRHADKLERARALGAWQTIDTSATPDWEKEVFRLTDKAGVDHVIEVGGPGTLGKSLLSVAAGGQIALIGVLTGFGAPAASLFPLMARNARIDGIYVGSRRDFEELCRALPPERIEPAIGARFDFADAPQAFAMLEAGMHFGKIVIRLPAA